jgi:hypothetical protein
VFNDIKQFAHYFRYRETAKLQLPRKRYEQLRSGKDDTPPGSTLVLPVAADAAGFRSIPVQPQPVRMYQNYQSLLTDLAARMGWDGRKLTVGEDVAYANMVACPSARWLNRKDSQNPTMPPMTLVQQRGIVAECFHKRSYFLRQLFQSLPAVLMVFSQSTADAFIGEMQGKFSKNAPKVGDKIDDLLTREIRLGLGATLTGAARRARCLLAAYYGDRQHFEQ